MSGRAARLFMSINVTMLDRERRGGKAPTCCAITRYTSGKGHLPLDQSAMPPKGIMVTIRIGGEELLKTGKERVEGVYGVTRLCPERATHERLLALVRGQWQIENQSHWVRDVTFDEVRSQVRCG